MGNSAITGINLGVPAFQKNFGVGDTPVITVNHNLNSQYVSVTVFDNNNLIIIPDDVDAVSTTQLTVDVTSYGTITGTWRIVVVDTGANINNIATDLELSGQAAEDFAIFDGSSWKAKGGAEIRVVSSHIKDLTAASGTQAVTGIGFKPSYVVFFAATNSADASYSSGSDDGVTANCVYQAEDNGNTQHRVTKSIIFTNAAETVKQEANITSFDSDGFTLTWVKTGSPTGTLTFRIMAFR